VKRVAIVYFSDVLCVWAYWAQLRIDEALRHFGDQVEFQPRFCSVFGDTAQKIATGWASRGGYDGFRAHILDAAAGFPESPINPAIWAEVRPASSMAPHLVLKAIQLGTQSGHIDAGVFEAAVLGMRRAFFEEGRDVSAATVQYAVAEAAGADLSLVSGLIADGRAHAALWGDYRDADALGVKGSPTFILNEGRQRLFGNVGYRIIEANIEEMLRVPQADQASWC
jgi:predicted DsbA family dithiol-disulfide isomerase